MKYITFCLVVGVLACGIILTPQAEAATASADQLTEQQRLIQLELKMAALRAQSGRSILTQQTDTRPPRLWGVDGPTTLPAGAAGGWNQDSRNRPSQYTYFARENIRWTWGDGSKSISDGTPENFHAYKKPGTYKAKLEGLDAQGKVVDTVHFTVNVTKAKKYGLKITKLDTKRDYKIGGKIPVAYTVKNAPSVNTAAWVGFKLINDETAEEFFLTDAGDARGFSGALELPGANDYSQDGPLSPGEYRLEAYMYGSGSSKFPSVKSRPFTISLE
jgi:hypothetical protein